MAVRTITTRLALDGETQFKQAMAGVNSALRTVKSEIALSEAQFKGQANTLDALTAKNKLLTQAIDQQKEKVKTLAQAVVDSAAAYGEDSTTTDKYRQQLNRAQTELIYMNRALSENSRYLEEAKNSADGTAKSIDGFGFATKRAGDSVTTLARALQAAGVAMTLKQIADAILECTDASVDFESAVAGYNKVAKLSNAELANMKERFKDLSTQIPATTTVIAQVAEAGARLGIGKENILEFTRVMIDLGNVSDLAAEQAATALARFANVVGTSANDYERLGSVIVALGNNFATSESEITELGSRLASAGKLANLTEPQIMALAAAMSSVGIQAEAGGTAMTQTLTAIEKAVDSGGSKLDQFAQIAGMSSSQFAQAWQGDPMTAITAFIGGLGQLDAKGESATQVLDELGLSGIRQSNMLKSLALASNTLVSALDTANAAWVENNELVATAAELYDTKAAKDQMAANAANNLKIAIGDALTPALGALAEGAVPVIGVMETVIKDNPWLVQGITAVVTVVGLLTAGVTAYSVIAPIAATATGALAAALNLLPLVGIATGIAAVVAGLKSLVEWLGRSKDETEEFTETAENAGDAAGELGDGLDEAAEAAFGAAEVDEALADAAGNTAPALEDLAAATRELEETTLYLAGAVDTLSDALKEQEKNGSLSLKTTNELIDAGYAAAIAIDEETGMVTLNQEEYVRLASAKIRAQIATLEVQKASLEAERQAAIETVAVQEDSSAYWDLAKAKAAATNADDIRAVELQIAALNRAQEALNGYGNGATTAARRSTSASKTIKTQAEQDLAAYKELKAELDHQKTLELVSEEEYYRRLAGYRDDYLTDDANVSEYRKVTEQIYKYDKALADQEAALWAGQTETLISELEERVKSLTDQQDKMEDRLSGYGDLFEIKDDKMSLNSLQDQIDAINDYEEALSRLRDRNVSQSLMDEVLGMDIDSATQYANQLLAMSEDQWEQYNDLWEEKRQRAAEVAEQFFRDQLDALENEYNDKLGDALDNLSDTSFGAGENTAQGLIDGLASMESALYAQAQKMADQVSSILNSAGRIPSNSELAAAMSTERLAERYQGVTGQQLQNAVIGGVNALSTSSGSVVYPPVDVTLTLDGQTLARQQVDPMRQAFKERPEVLDDSG